MHRQVVLERLQNESAIVRAVGYSYPIIELRVGIRAHEVNQDGHTFYRVILINRFTFEDVVVIDEMSPEAAADRVEEFHASVALAQALFGWMYVDPRRIVRRQ